MKRSKIICAALIAILIILTIIQPFDDATAKGGMIQDAFNVLVYLVAIPALAAPLVKDLDINEIYK